MGTVILHYHVAYCLTTADDCLLLKAEFVETVHRTVSGGHVFALQHSLVATCLRNSTMNHKTVGFSTVSDTDSSYKNTVQ